MGGGGARPNLKNPKREMGACPLQVAHLQTYCYYFGLKHESFIEVLSGGVYLGDVETSARRGCHMSTTARSKSKPPRTLAGMNRKRLLPFGGMCRWTLKTTFAHSTENSWHRQCFLLRPALLAQLHSGVQVTSSSSSCNRVNESSHKSNNTDIKCCASL